MPLQIINGVGRAGVRVTTATPQVSYDTDAQAFITAAALTDTTQKNAINDLVLDLKGAGIWTKMKALYPMVGGTATTHKFNLKDPRDLEAAYRLTFYGGWTHTSTGALPNGSTGYANTNLVPNTALTTNNHSMAVYSRTNNTTTAYDMACQSIQASSTQYGYMTLSAYNTGTSRYQQQTQNTNAITVSEANTLGFYQGSRTSSTSFKGYKNGILKGTNTNITSAISSYLPINSIYLSAFNFNNNGVISTSDYSNRECAFASIGDGLTDLESNLFYQIVEKYQYALGRNVNANQTFYFNRNYSNETNAFIFNGAISDATQQSAINTLVNDLKAAGIWTKMKAVYPMVGGTATSHKFNLVNPIDSTSAYALTFNGGWTHSTNGATPNGTTGYANTNLIPSTTFNTTTFNHLSYYSRTNSSFIGDNVMGALEAFKNNSLIIRNNTNFCATYADYPSGNVYRNAYITNQTNGQGLFIGSQTGTNIKLFRNNNLLASNTTVRLSNGNLPTVNMYLGATNYPNPTAGSFTNKECAFASIGDGLTDAEATTFYNAVQAFQTTLGRQV